MLHQVFDRTDFIILVYSGFGIALLINLLGFAMMQVPEANLQGKVSIIVGNSIFYPLAGVAINSVLLSSTTRTLRCTIFTTLFAAAYVSMLAVGLTFLLGDNDTFLLVRLFPN